MFIVNYIEVLLYLRTHLSVLLYSFVFCAWLNRLLEVVYISRCVTWVFLNVVVCTKNCLICALKGNHGYLSLCPSINTKVGHVSENPIDYPEKGIEKFENIFFDKMGEIPKSDLL